MRALVVSVALAACAPPQLTLSVQIPADVDRVAGLAIGEYGQMLGGTGLFGADDIKDQLVILGEDVDRVSRIVVVGWSDDTLIKALGAVLPNDDVIRRSQLTAATTTQPILPAPDFGAEAAWPGPGTGSLTTGLHLELFTSWLPACPRLSPDGKPAIESCSGFYCGEHFKQDGCNLEVDLDGCLTGAPNQLAIGPRGTISGFTPALSCQTTEAASAASLAFDCGGCAFVAHLPPFEVPFEVSPPITVASVTDPTARLFDFAYPVGGNLVGIVGLPRAETSCPFPSGRIVALTRSGLSECSAGQELVVIDSESMAELGRAPVDQGCVAAIFADPTGNGVLVVFDKPLAIARYGCDLTMVEHQRLVAPDLGPTTPLTAGALLPSAGTTAGRIVLAFLRSNDAGLAEIDPQALVVSRTFVDLGFAAVRTIEALGPGRAVIGTTDAPDSVHRVRAFDLTTHPPTFAVSEYRVGSKPSKLVNGIVPLPRTGKLVVSSPAIDALATAVVRIGSIGELLGVEAADYTAKDASPSGGYPWRAPPAAAPDAEDLVLLATTLEGADRLPKTRIGLLDVTQRRFLPDRVEVGFGPVGRIVEDESGALWLPMVWQGTLVRIRPSPPRTLDEAQR